MVAISVKRTNAPPVLFPCPPGGSRRFLRVSLPNEPSRFVRSHEYKLVDRCASRRWRRLERLGSPRDTLELKRDERSGRFYRYVIMATQFPWAHERARARRKKPIDRLVRETTITRLFIATIVIVYTGPDCLGPDAVSDLANARCNTPERTDDNCSCDILRARAHDEYSLTNLTRVVFLFQTSEDRFNFHERPGGTQSPAART